MTPGIRMNTRRPGGIAAGLAAFGVVLAIFSGSGQAASKATPLLANNSSPVVSGTTLEGETLTTSNGSWTSSSQITYTYQWRRCNQTGSDCPLNIPGANERTYTLTRADVGSSLRSIVIAENAEGRRGSAPSGPTAVVSARMSPANTSSPMVSGKALEGETLTTTNGSWTSPSQITYTYQWRRCNQTGSDCPLTIPGANERTYTLSRADVGRSLRSVVIAENSSGRGSALSAPTATVSAAGQPVSTSPPVVSGRALEGETLTTTNGSWTSPSQIAYTYQWRRCNQTGSDCPLTIPGANERTYTLTRADVGRSLRSVVIAENSSGRVSVLSAPSAVVAPKAPPPPPPVRTGCPAGSDAIRADQISPPARLRIDRQTISPAVVTGGTQTLTVRFHVSACGGRPVQGMLVYVTAVPYNQFTIPQEQPTGSDGWAQLTMQRARSFPAARNQQLLVLFARARKGGENLLGGISTRRLVSFRVDLSR